MIFLDSCTLIYAVADRGVLGDRVRTTFSRSDETFAISPLVIHETVVHPLRLGDEALVSAFAELFERMLVLPLELGTYLTAARLRAASPGLKTVDALHVAAARLAGCTALWTNDRRLAAASGGLAVDIVGDVNHPHPGMSVT